jgi:DNA helicase-2/ATP-dependent DNA helicase PcrA
MDLDSLNENQRRAVEWTAGPLLVLAGPGSGKTRVLTIRIARILAESRGKPFRVLGLTFTNKAADEMRERLTALAPEGAERALLTTFHAFCADVLRQHGSHLGVRPDFTILNQEADQIAVLAEVVRRVAPDAANPGKVAEDYLPPVRSCLEAFARPDDIPSRFKNPQYGTNVRLLYEGYRQELATRNALDFPSLLLLTHELLAAKPAVARQLRIIYPHVCVDEFQDTNLAQYTVLRQVIGDRPANLFVVADDDQIIYEWNGASPERLRQIRTDYGMEVIQLPTNYRCPYAVIDLANNLIGHNLDRSPESLVEDVYVEVLILRGLVEQKKGRGRGEARNVRRRIESGELCRAGLQRIEEFRRRVQQSAQTVPGFMAVAHVAGMKERDLQVITLPEILAILDQRSALLQTGQGTLEGPANAVFVTGLLEKSGERLLRVARGAAEKVRAVAQGLAATYNTYCTQVLPRQLAAIPVLLDLSLDVSALEEMAELRTVKEQAEGILAEGAPQTADDIHTHLRAIPPKELQDSFWHATLDEENYCHNYHAFQAARCEAAFKERGAVVDRLLSTIAERLQNPLSRRDALYRQVISRNADDLPPISRAMLQALQSKVQPATGSSGQEGQAARRGVPSLHRLTQVIDEQFSELSSAVGDLESCLELWGRVWQAKGELRQRIGQDWVRLAAAEEKFNLPEQAAALRHLKAFFSEGEEQYKYLCRRLVEVTRPAFDDVRKKVISTQEHFEEIDGLVRSDLWQPFALMQAAFLGTLEKRIRACDAVGALPEALCAHFTERAGRYRVESSLEGFLDGAETCAQQVADLKEIERQAGDILSAHLTLVEKQLLDRLIDLAGQVPGEGGIDLDQLRESVPGGERELLSVTGELWRKGVLSVRIRL